MSPEPTQPVTRAPMDHRATTGESARVPMDAARREPTGRRGAAGGVDGLWSERFDLIDAWRGLAALAVVVHHVALINIGGPAVMLFFVISGYCIAASADSCKRKNLGFGKFMMRRVRRIYPPYLLSVAFWTLTRAIKAWQGGHNDLVRAGGAVEWIQNLTLTQWLSLLRHPLPTAAGNPTLFVTAYWSLCYEEQFYLLLGLMLLASQALGVSIRAMVLALIGVALAWNVVFPETCYGVFIEYWAMFGIGAVVFYRLCRLANPLHRRLVDIGLVTLLAVCAYVRWFSGAAWAADAPGLAGMDRASYRVAYEELAICAAFALVLIASRPFSEAIRSKALYRPFAALGQITFSLYLIHQFNLVLVRKLVETPLSWAGLVDPGADSRAAPWYSLVLQIAAHVAMASVFWFFCERPFLNKSLLPASGAGNRPAGAAGDGGGGAGA